jgi:hypothetical protein
MGWGLVLEMEDGRWEGGGGWIEVVGGVDGEGDDDVKPSKASPISG